MPTDPRFRAVTMAAVMAAMAVTSAQPRRDWDERVVSVPIIGRATAYVPASPSSHVILFLSGDGGWNLGVVDMARRIMPKAIVIGVPYPALRKEGGAAATSCWMPAGDLETISHAAQRALDLSEYHPPILIGYSSGATLVYTALASAPATAFAGGLSLGFCPDLPASRPVCEADNFKPTFDAGKNTAWMPKVDRLERDWYVLNGEQDQVCLPPAMHKFLDDMPGAHFIEVPGTGHGFSRPGRWGDPFDRAFEKLLAVDSKPKITSPRPTESSSLSLERQLDVLKLPLEYRWADRARATLVFISGDGGWASIDEHLAAYLNARGVSVVGMSTVRYFWKQKTPEQTAADMHRVFDVLEHTNGPIFIGGYSFGAEVTPFVLDAWTSADRRKVNGQILLAPGETASFQVSPLDWVFRAKQTSFRVADAVRHVALPTLCVVGQREASRDTACDDMGGTAESVTLPGSHHFNGKYDELGRIVLTFIESHLAR